MKISILSSKVLKKSGTSKKGSAYEFFWQEATAETPRFRQPVNIALRSEADAFAPGDYTLDADAFLKVDGFSEFATERYPTLVPVKVAGEAAGAPATK